MVAFGCLRVRALYEVWSAGKALFSSSVRLLCMFAVQRIQLACKSVAKDLSTTMYSFHASFIYIYIYTLSYSH